VKRPKILFLADRNILIDDPKDKTFISFGDARHKISNGEVVKSREMYFAIYQAIAEDERRPGLYKEFGPDFFDLIIIDECHRGSRLLAATRGVGARRERVRPEMLLEIELPFPKLEEQVKCSHAFDRLEETSEVSANASLLHKTLTPSLLDRIFNRIEDCPAKSSAN
jgi:hypothetical protein